MKPHVSVIVPVYGCYDTRRLVPVLDSISWQTKLTIEVVLAESSPTPCLEQAARDAGVEYCFLPHDDANGPYRPGRIRNFGICHSSADVIYMTDGDIVLQNRLYVCSVLQEFHDNGNGVLRWPSMRRIPLAFADVFLANVASVNLHDALGALRMDQAYVALPEGAIYPLAVIRRKQMQETGQVFTTRPEHHAEYFAAGKWKGMEPQILHQVLHMGGIMMSRVQCATVGGYCEEYVGWGNEDIDLQWKLRAQYDVRQISERQETEVIHIDHDKPYLMKDTWAANKARLEQRKLHGAEVCMQKDRLVFENVHSL